MSPYPLVRTLLIVTKLYFQRIPRWFFGVAFLLGVLLVVEVMLAVPAYYVFKGVIHGKGKDKLIVGANIKFLLIVCLFLFYDAIGILFWGALLRLMDRTLLGGNSQSGWSKPLVQAGFYSQAMTAGAGVLVFAALKALPFRLHLLGVPTDIAHDGVIVILVLIFVPLFLRLQLLMSIVALDAQRVGVAWRLALKTLAGKSLPLLIGTLLQFVLILPFFFLLGGVFEAVLASWKSGYPPVENTAIFAAAYIVLSMFAYSLQAALQAGAMRHFFGYGANESARYREQMLVADPNEVYVVDTPVGYDTPFAVGYGVVRPKEEITYFDPTALEDEVDLTPALPPLYQPQDTPSLTPRAESATTPVDVSPILQELNLEDLKMPSTTPVAPPPAPAAAAAPAAAPPTPPAAPPPAATLARVSAPTDDDNPFMAFDVVEEEEGGEDEDVFSQL
jgi:hypothetical protein